MKKIILMVLVIFILMITLLHGEKIGVLKEVLKPESMTVADGKLFVVQREKFYVYSLDGLELLTSFGKKGEGPGELKVMPLIPNSITVLPEAYFIEGVAKVMFLSKEAKLIKELKKTNPMSLLKILPVGENYAAVQMVNPTPTDKKHYLALSLLDPELNLIKVLYKQEFPERETEIVMVTDSIHFDVHDDKIYVEESDNGFLIEVFDAAGARLSSIRKHCAPQKISEKDRAAIFENFKQDDFVRAIVRRQGGWENFKKSITFDYPETYPCIRDILVTGDKIYVSTYERKGDTEKYVVMDLAGETLSTPYLPIPQDSSFIARTMGRDNRFYGISGGKYYYLKENPEEEEWGLHSRATR